MDFGDLVASAEQLTAEIDGARAGDLPRVERSLKHIVDAGQSLLGKSAGQGQDAKASILLGSRGVDLPAISSKIGAIQSTNILTESEKVGRSIIVKSKVQIQNPLVGNPKDWLLTNYKIKGTTYISYSLSKVDV